MRKAILSEDSILNLGFKILKFFIKNRQQGVPSFNPSHRKNQKSVIRSKPSIPRPEMREQTTIYEQIIELKRKNLDKNDIDIK